MVSLGTTLLVIAVFIGLPVQGTDFQDPMYVNANYTAQNPIDVFGPCDDGTLIDDACQAFIIQECDGVQDPAVRDICNQWSLTPEVDPHGSWENASCDGTAVKKDVQETTVTVQASDPTGVASLATSYTISSFNIDWSFQCKATLQAWATGSKGFGREVEVDLTGNKMTCEYTGLPGDVSCTTPSINHLVTSTISKGTVEKDAEGLPDAVKADLAVPITAYNRGVTPFGPVPGVTVYDDALRSLETDLIVVFTYVDAGFVDMIVDAADDIDLEVLQASTQLQEDVQKQTNLMRSAANAISQEIGADNPDHGSITSAIELVDVAGSQVLALVDGTAHEGDVDPIVTNLQASL